MRPLLISLAASLSLVFFGSLTLAPTAHAQNLKRNACSGANLSLDGSKGCNVNSAGNPAENQSDINTLITRVINILSVIVGLVAVVMIIFGGFKFITAGGDREAVASAKTTIVYAIVGLIIVAFAQFIVKFIVGKIV